MNILVACERSGIVTEAFRKRDHDAYSCDIVPTEGKHPQWHIQKDVFKTLEFDARNHTQDGKGCVFSDWDVILGFPPCTHLAVSGARWFPEKRADGSQRKAIEFFLNLWESPVPRIVIENPIGIMSGKREYLKKWYPDLYERAKSLPEPQIIQPWMFGHGETKATCLWLKNLPELKPTNIVEGREQRVHKMPPSEHRAMDRARTYQGIADAMSEQWGG